MDETNRERSDGGGKRRYERPAVDETAPFETLALTCGKTYGTSTCPYSGGYTNS